jgi:cyclopropane fatty-acyl-phospholipid synthase-like methyltransferase
MFTAVVSHPLRRILEIGCSTGEFCSVSAQAGVVPFGLDMSAAGIKVARERYPELEFQVGQIEDIEKSRCFDAIFGFEVIEHMLSPKAFMAIARTLLCPGGLLVLSTPNLECGRARGFDKWLGFEISFEHLYFLSVAAMRQYAATFGFEVVTWFTGGGDGAHSPPQKPPAARRLVKALLAEMRVLDAVRRWRRRYIGVEDLIDLPLNDYKVGGTAHNLYIILKRTGTESTYQS